jgi:hypothetical protein
MADVTAAAIRSTIVKTHDVFGVKRGVRVPRPRPSEQIVRQGGKENGAEHQSEITSPTAANETNQIVFARSTGVAQLNPPVADQRQQGHRKSITGGRPIRPYPKRAERTFQHFDLRK